MTIEQAVVTENQPLIQRFADLYAEPYTLDRFAGISPSTTALKSRLAQLAADLSPAILFCGDTGTGKQLAAKVVHYAGPRGARAFMGVTCSRLPQNLLETELFGEDVTVFFDEIADIPEELRPVLLTFLRDRPDIRVFAATTRDINAVNGVRAFAADLLTHLRAEIVTLPTLARRMEDLPALVDGFLARFNRKFRKSVRGVSGAALDMLSQYSWPGNVGELRNAVERAVLLTDSVLLEPVDFIAGPQQEDRRFFVLPPDGVELESVERALVQQALERTRWNQTRAARLLGINRDQIHYRIEKFKLHLPGRPAA